MWLPSIGSGKMREGDAGSTDIRELLNRRADVLGALADGDASKADLTDALDVSRSTVDRAVRRLETHDLVRRTGGTVSVTLAGRLAYDTHRRYTAEVETVARFSDLLGFLPAMVDVGLGLLDGATAVRSEPPTTGRPSTAVLDLFRAATRVRGCANVVNDPAAAKEFFRLITERGGSGEFVYTTALADHFREEYFEMTHELVSTGRYRAHEIDALPYELFLVDGEGWTRVAVLVYDGSETLRGAIVNDTDAAVDWAQATFERYRRAATEFTDEFRVGDDGERP
jgi:predicted transcriptional regulator